MSLANLYRFALAAAAWFGIGGSLAAQQTDKPWAFLSPDPNLTAIPSGAVQLDLRTNITQPLYLYGVNPTEDRPTLTFEVRAGTLPVATAEKTLAAGTSGSPRLEKIAMKSVAAPAVAPTGAIATTTELPGVELPASMQFSVTVVGKGSNDPANESLQTVKLRNPASFLSNTTATFFGTENKLVVKVSAVDFQGPPCPVELTIAPNDVPGLVIDELKGVTRGVLSADQKEVILYAAGLIGAVDEGFFSLTVDGVERAVVFRGNFHVAQDKDSGPFLKVIESGLRVDVRPFARPGQDVVARVAAFNAPGNANLKLTFGQGVGTNRVVAQTFTHVGPREQRAAALVTPEGDLAVTTVARAWAPHLDTRGIYGPCTLAATLTTPDNKLLEAQGLLVLDDTPPKGDFDVEVGKPMTVERGQLLSLRAVGEDPDSGITRVEFFVGAEPPVAGPDGKFPAEPKPVLAEAIAPQVSGAPPRIFAAKLLIPDSKLPVPVYVRFTNGVGLTTVKRVDVAIVDPPIPLGSIKGQVYYGEVLQKGLTVTLYTSGPKWDVVKTTVIDAEGNFVFASLPPGDYRLGCVNPPRKTKGYTSVTVKAGTIPTPVKLEIKQ
ncbi:MAG: hypothetical protein ACJ8C4_11290 [Gemmataceae bacterium]